MTMEKIHYVQTINCELYAYTFLYNIKTKCIENVSCTVRSKEYNSGTVWNTPVKINSIKQLEKIIHNYELNIQIEGDTMEMKWYIDIVDDYFTVTLFYESIRADNVAKPDLVDDTKDEATWLAEELESLTLNEIGEKKIQVEDIPIYMETSIPDSRDKLIEELNATIQKQQYWLKHITANSIDYANSTYVCIKQVNQYLAEIDTLKEKVAKQSAAIAKYKDQITRQCTRIYTLKQELNRANDPYAWK